MKRQKLDSLGISAFCESMGMMVQAGIQTDEAVSLLRDEEHVGGPLAAALEIMVPEMECGVSLGQAMEKCAVFPAYAVQMIAAGEKTGRLEDVLFRLSDYYARQKEMSEKLQSAVTYPALMMVLMIAVLVVMLTAVLPVFTGVYDSMTGSLTASSYSYIRWAYGFCALALGVMAVLTLALAVGLVLWRTERGRRTVETALSHVPACAGILRSMGLFRVTSSLSVYLASGAPQDTALAQSMEMAEYAPVREKLGACAEKMEQGRGFAASAYDVGLFEPVYGRMLLAGERTGNLEKVLARLTGLLQEHCAALTDKLVGFVDPLLSGVLMLTVALSLISVMLPLIGMMGSIG